MTAETLAEVLWNLEGAPPMDDQEYTARYVAEARKQLKAASEGEIESWWENDD